MLSGGRVFVTCKGLLPPCGDTRFYVGGIMNELMKSRLFSVFWASVFLANAGGLELVSLKANGCNIHSFWFYG